MSPDRTLAIAVRIVNQIVRDRRSVAMIIVAPVAVMSLVGFSFIDQRDDPNGGESTHDQVTRNHDPLVLARDGLSGGMASVAVLQVHVGNGGQKFGVITDRPLT